MGFRHFSSLLILFFMVMMIFGTHRLRDIGGDLAIAIRNFRKGLQDEEEKKSNNDQTSAASAQTPTSVQVNSHGHE